MVVSYSSIKAKADLKEHADNADELQKAEDALMQASYKMAEILYKDAGAAQQDAPEDHGDAAPHAGANQSSNETFDAEIS